MKKIDGRKVIELWYEIIMAREMELNIVFGDGWTSEEFEDDDWARVAIAFNKKLKDYIKNPDLLPKHPSKV